MKCPACGHTWTPPTRARASRASIDTATLSDTDVFAYCRRTAPLEDLRFFAAHCDDETLQQLCERLRVDAFDGERLILTRTAFYTRLTAIQQQWRERETRAVPSDETAFWRAAVRTNVRERARKYREARDRVLVHVRETCTWTKEWHQPTPHWCIGESVDDMITQTANEVRDLVRAAREIYTTRESTHENQG